VQQIVIASERAADLTKQMLAFSGKGSFVVEPMDLNTLVQENFMLLRASLSRSINIELRLGDEPCIIEADRGQMQQIVMNVLINASEAIGDNLGKIEIRTALIERTGSESSVLLRGVVPPGRYAFFEVRDNGSGMVPETVKRIFDPFFTTKFTGRGLGLAAVLGIVRGHGGDIEVETQLGVGATFRVLLPASERTVSVSKEPEPRCVARGTGQTILVVDDKEIVRNIAITALKIQGLASWWQRMERRPWRF
jgi:signal transduction histidine kinase